MTRPSGSQTTTISKGTSIVFEGPSGVLLLKIGAWGESLLFPDVELAADPKASPDAPIGGETARPIIEPKFDPVAFGVASFELESADAGEPRPASRTGPNFWSGAGLVRLRLR